MSRLTMGISLLDSGRQPVTEKRAFAIEKPLMPLRWYVAVSARDRCGSESHKEI